MVFLKRSRMERFVASGDNSREGVSVKQEQFGRRRRLPQIVMLGTLAGALALPGVATAVTSQRSFVASYGDDSKPCTTVQPCRGFAAALAATNAGGEIIVLDSAGYGPVTIDKSVTIVAPSGVYAGITVVSGNGITIATNGIDVRLKGLTINGLGGNYGIRVTAGNTVRMEDCTIANISWGVRVDGPVLMDVRASRFDRNASGGIWVQNGATLAVSDSEFIAATNGVFVTSTITATTRASVARSSFVRVSTGLRALGAPTTANVYASISDSTFTGDHTTASGYLAVADCQPAGACIADQVRVAATRNVVTGASVGGIYANANGSTIIATQNTISDSSIGLAGMAGGAIWTLQDNAVYKNTIDTNGVVTDKTYR